MRWSRSPSANDVFAGQGVTAPLPRTGMVGGYEAGWEGGVTGNPGGVNLMMANVNAEQARKASEVLGEEVLPLAGVNWDEGVPPPGNVLAAYTPYMRAAYDADSFRPDSGDERRIIGDKYAAARKLGGLSAEQFARARALDPSILDLEQQRREAISRANKALDRAEQENTNAAGTVAWLAGEMLATIEPSTNPAWALNILGLAGKTLLTRVAGAGVVAGAQSIVEDVMPLDGLPSREEAMAWLGRDNDVAINALTAVAMGAAFQGFGEIVAKGFGRVSPKVMALVRSSPVSEEQLLRRRNDAQANRVADAQILDHVNRQLDEGVPASELVPPSAPLSDHVSVMPDSRASVEPPVGTQSVIGAMTEEQLAARVKAIDKEAAKNYPKAVEAAKKMGDEVKAVVERETGAITRRIEELNRAIADAEARNDDAMLQNLYQQHDATMAAHETAMKSIQKKIEAKQAKVMDTLATWQKRMDVARARAKGEFDLAASRGAVRNAAASPVARAPENAPVTPAASARPIGEPIERPAPPTDHPLAPDTGEGTVVQRAQRVVDAKAQAAAEVNKAWVTDLKRKLKDYIKAVETKDKAKADPDAVVLGDGTRVADLLKLRERDINLETNQPLGRAYDLERELEELDGLDETMSISSTCATRAGGGSSG